MVLVLTLAFPLLLLALPLLMERVEQPLRIDAPGPPPGPARSHDLEGAAPEGYAPAVERRRRRGPLRRESRR